MANPSDYRLGSIWIAILDSHRRFGNIRKGRSLLLFVTLNQWQKPGLLYELETLILQAAHPPYNLKIPREQ